MSLRKMTLSGTWYPDTKKEVDRTIGAWTGAGVAGGAQRAAVVPHAGWYYSGKIAARTLSSICRERELIIIIGGHLPPGSPVLAAFEDEFDVPGGRLANRIDLLKELGRKIGIEEDVFRDNTVEVVLPMAAHFSPAAEILWLRAPSDLSSVALAAEIFEITQKKKIDAAVAGSTDLTHYGSSYYFNPAGRGASALKWVKEKNDAGIIGEMLDLNAENVLTHAAEHKSACSAGAAAAAVVFGKLSGAKKGTLIDYYTSYDVCPAESFVGYAGIRF